MRARGVPVAAGLLAGFLDLVFPPACLGCDRRIPAAAGERLVCGECRRRLQRLVPPLCPRCGAPALRTGRPPGPVCGECREWPATLRAARSVCLLEPPADRLVHQLKYRGWRVLAEPLAGLMAALPLPADVVRERGPVIPVPTTAARRRQRGYDQAELLAAALARRSGRRMLPVLVRARPGGSQTLLQSAARAANLAGAVRVAPGRGADLAGAHPLLVDDVLTTGATANECVRALVAAGARCVTVLTFARALGPAG
jgi:ComF family protein